MSGEIVTARAITSCQLKILRGFMLIRSVILAVLAFVAAALVAFNYMWKGEWSRAIENSSKGYRD